MISGASSLADSDTRRTAPSAALVAVAGLALVAAAVAPFASIKGPALAGLTPFFCAFILVTELATSILLFVTFQSRRTMSLHLLATAYLYSGLMAVAYLVTFPGALLPAVPLIGGPQSAAWVFVAWTVVFASLADAAAIIETRWPDAVVSREAVVPLIVLGAAAAIAAAGAAGAVAAGSWRLPTLVDANGWTPLYMVLHVLSTTLMFGGVAIITAGLRGRSNLFAWLSVALMAMTAANFLAAFSGGRFSLGWTGARVGFVLSAGVLFGLFLWIFARQQTALARARDGLEEEVAVRTAALTAMVRERDVLLSEVYHRVNNNLQTVAALLLLERKQLADPKARTTLERMAGRARAMGLVHQQIMSSGELHDLDLADFLRRLCQSLRDSLALDAKGVELEVEAEPLRADIDVAMPLGLLVNELVVNAARHAFQGRDRGRIVISLREANGRWRLQVRDDGIGIEEAAEGLGSRIVAGLVDQLGGTQEIMSEAGLARRVEFPSPRMTQ